KLHATYHPSSTQRAAEILQLSLWNKKERQQFIDNLQKAYDKSISKSYKEIISDSVNNFVKQQWSVATEAKLDVMRVLALGILVVLLVLSVSSPVIAYISQFGGSGPIVPSVLIRILQTVSGVVSLYLAWSITATFSRSRGSDRN